MEKRSQPAILNLIVVKNPYRVFYTNVLIIFMRYKLNFFFKSFNSAEQLQLDQTTG